MRQRQSGSLGRLSEIAQVATRHGFGYVLRRNRLGDLVHWGSSNGAEGSTSDRGRRLREMLDELGPTFVKFGQLLSTRPDVVPPDIVAELRRLQDDVSPFAFDDVRAVVESELELTVEQAFVAFDPLPIASANGNGVTSSWSFRSSTTMSGGITSGRVERSWPNFTNVGPSSSSISRNRRPRSASCCSSLLRLRSSR